MRIGRSTTESGTSKGHEVHAKNVFAIHLNCPHCGKPLNRRTVELFGKQYEVTDYGSCGCEASQWDGLDIPNHQKAYAMAGIPARYINAEADLNGWDSAIADGKSLYICGPYGAGKTYYACALAKRLIDRGLSVRFENAGHVMTEIKGTYNGRQSDVLERSYACRVLVLDDLGKESPTEHSIAMLYELVDSRYMDGKPIVVTSNFSHSELMQRWAKADAATAESIISRLCDGMQMMRMDGSDRRMR